MYCFLLASRLLVTRCEELLGFYAHPRETTSVRIATYTAPSEGFLHDPLATRFRAVLLKI